MSQGKKSGNNVNAVVAAAAAAMAGAFGSRDAIGAPVNLTTATYTQNFDHSTWAKNGGSSMGTGWALSETGTGANANYTDTSGSATAADTYVFHTGSDNDLAFGTLRGSTSLVSTIGANFANTLGAGNNIVALQISYNGEQWRRGGTGSDRLDFQISTDATSLTTGAWTDQNALDFASLQNSGAAAALDGNAAANRTAITSTITGLNVTNTSQFWIRWLDADNTVEHGLGLDDFSLKALTTGYDSQITSSGTVAFGRVMQNSTPSNNSSASLTKTGSQGTTYSATGSVGVTVSAPGSFGTGDPESHNLTIGLANVAAGSGTTGSKNFTVTVDNLSATSGAAGQGSADANDTINVSATVLANRLISASSIGLGRRMVNVAQSGTSNLSTTLDNNNATAVTVATTTAADANGLAVTGGSGTSFNSAASTGTRSVGGMFTSTGVKSGTLTLLTTGEGLTGEAPINVDVGYTATAVDNRIVTAATAGMGTVLVNTATSGSSSLSTSGDNDNFTAVMIALTGGPDVNGVSVTGGSGSLFAAAADTGSRTVGGTFATAGGYSGNVTLTTTGEGLAGEAPVNVLVPYTATALDHSNGSFDTPTDTDTLNINFGTVLLNTSQSSGFSLYNLLATIGFTADLDLDAINEAGDTFNKFSHNMTATTLVAGGGNGYSVFFDTTSPGAFSATYTLDLSDQDLPGATSQSMTINVSGQVVPEPAAGAAPLLGSLGAATLRRRRRSA